MRPLSTWVLSCALAAGVGLTFAQKPDESAGKKEEQASCLPCHSLRLIETQRLSPAAWQKEVDKMIGWGAVVPDKQLLIDYLSEHYGKAQDPPPVTRSVDSK